MRLINKLERKYGRFRNFRSDPLHCDLCYVSRICPADVVRPELLSDMLRLEPGLYPAGTGLEA